MFISAFHVFLLSGLVISLNVFIIPHSHNDLGWVETAEDCYLTKVRFQLDNMLTMLSSSLTYKFSFSEMYYLSRYIKDFPEQIPVIKNFISQGRLEIVGGGWAQNDEGLVDFEIALRNIEAGFEFLHRKLGVNRVRVGWQIDPFGHSSLTAALWEKLGYEMLVIWRIHYKTLVKII